MFTNILLIIKDGGFMKNNTFKKVLITTTTLVLLALVVVMCMLPFGKSGELPQLTNGMDFSFNTGETANIGSLARVDGFLTSVAENVNIKYTQKSFQGAAYEYDRMHIDYTVDNALDDVYLIGDATQWAAFLNQTAKKVGVLIDDITLSDAVLKQMELANTMTIDGNGYEITVDARSYNESSNEYLQAGAAPTIDSYQVYGGSKALVGAGFIVGTNRGTIKNLTVKFTSTVKLPNTNNNDAYASINGIRHVSYNNAICVGILAGINLGTISNVTIDIENPFHYRRDGSYSNGISTNTSYVGGAVGAAGKDSLTERVTVRNTAGIVAYSKIDTATIFSAGVIANASAQANIRYISTAGAGQVSAYCFTDDNKSYSAGVIGGNYTTESGSVANSSFSAAKHFVGFISGWVGNSYDNQNTASGVAGKPTVGRMFGRFNWMACRDILLLFDYSRNGPDTDGQTTEVAIDGQYRLNYKDSSAVDIDVWSEAFTTSDTASKGFTTGGFVYKTTDGQPNTVAGKVVVSVATGAGIGVTPESVVGGLTGNTQKKLAVDSKGGIIWNCFLQGKSGEEFTVGSIETTHEALLTTDCRLVGGGNSNRCYEFGEAVGLKFTSAYGGVDEISYENAMTAGLSAPTLSVVSSINTSFIGYNAAGKYSLKLTAEIGGINVGDILSSNAKLPGKYHYKVQKSSSASGLGLDANIGLFDATAKILSYDSDETINYTFTLLKSVLTASGNSSGWQSEYAPTFTINNNNSNAKGLMSGMYIVANEVNQEPYDFTNAANTNIYTGYTYSQTTNAGGAVFKFTPYKEFSYTPSGSIDSQIIKVEVAEPLIVKGVKIDGVAPVVDLEMSAFFEKKADGTKTKISYAQAIGEWRNKDIVAKIAFRDDESGFSGDKSTYYVERTIDGTENVQFNATDLAGNSRVFNLECKIDKVSPTIGAAYKIMAPTIGDSVVTFEGQSGIHFNVLSGSAGGKLYFGTKNDKGNIDWIIERSITGSKAGATTTVTWTADKDRSPTNLVAKFVSNADNIYTDMYVAAISGNATQDLPGDENTIIADATSNAVLFEVRISTHNLFISLARLRYRLKGSIDTWETLTIDNIARIVNKTYDATRESKYEFSVDFSEFLNGSVTTAVDLTTIKEEGSDAQTRGRNVRLSSDDLDEIKIEATYDDENSGSVNFVFSATGPTKYNMYFYNGIGASAQKSKETTMTIQAAISAHNVSITANDVGFVSEYTFGDVINKDLTYSDLAKTFGQEIKFRITTAAITGSNIGVYGIGKVETISGGRNFNVKYDGFNNITIVKKEVSVNVLFGEGSKENDQGFTVAFDGLARTISGYYHDVNSQKLPLKVEIFTDEGRSDKLVANDGSDQVSIKAIGKYYITVSIADDNYRLMPGKEYWTFEITKGLLDIDESLRVLDYSGERQEYEVRIRMPEGVKASDVFSMADINVSYYKYSECRKIPDPDNRGEFIWEYEGLAASSTSDTQGLGAYKVIIKYADPDNLTAGGGDGMANYVDKEYYGILIVQRAEAQLTTNAEGNTLRIAWSGNDNHFNMIMANVKLTLPNVLVGADAAKAPKVMSAVSDVTADQVGKDLYPYIKLQTLVGNNWEDVQYWDNTSSSWRFGQVSGQTALGRKTYRITFLGTDEIKEDSMNVFLDVVAKQFTFSDSDIAGSIEKVYDGQSASVQVTNISELQDATITYIYAGVESADPFSFVNAGKYSVTILVKRDNYADRRVTVTVNITSAIFGEDLTISNVLDQVYDGKDYSPKINGLTQELVDNKTVYKYNGVEVNYILPRESNVGEHTGQIYISAANYERKTLDYVIKIIPKPVDVVISMPEGSTSAGYVWEKTNIASFVDIDGNKVDCRVRFLDANGVAVKLNADKTLPAGKYTVEVIMSNTNYVATADTKSINVNIGGGGINNLGAIIGGSVGGLIGLGGIAAIIAVLVIKKKRKA